MLTAFTKAAAINHDGKPLEIDFAGARLFMPISLDNPYYSSERISRIIKSCARHATETIWVLCDRLKLLNYCAADNQPADLPMSEAQKLYGDRVAKKFAETKAMIERAHGELKCDVRNFDPCMKDANYQRLVAAIEARAAHDEFLNAFINDAVKRKIEQIYGTNASLSASQWQRKYVVEETVMSLMHTELYGHNLELYRHHCNGLIDFLERERAAWLKEILGVDELKRVFVPLEPIVGYSQPSPVRGKSVLMPETVGGIPLDLCEKFSPLAPYRDPLTLKAVIHEQAPPAHRSALIARIL